MKNLIHKLIRHKEKFFAIIPFVVLAGILLSGRSARMVRAEVSSKFYQVSPRPTFTFTPISPTNTPPPTPTFTPISPTNTPPPTPTFTPISPTNTPPPTPTFTPIPPTPTDTPVPNVPPTINEIRGPLEPVAVNEEAVIAVSFFSPNAGDTHEALVNWGDGTRTYPPIDIGDHVFTETHPYVSSGIFSVVASITNLAGTSDTVKFEPVIVYDPNGGFVTGGGWIDSPAGAYQIDPELTGKATFGFVSKYKKSASAPRGLARFRLGAANLNFRSRNHEWLVVPGDDTAQLQGTGTINRKVAPNGQPYRFMVWAKDGAPDTLRIKIWYEESGGEMIVYDNGAEQPIRRGSIKIHKRRKGR